MSALPDDVDVGALVLQVVGSKLSRRGVRVDPRVLDGTIERTIDGASTLTFTLDDSDRTLIRSGLFDRQIDVQFDGLWWRLVKVAKSGDTLTLTFEDRAVAYLRLVTTPRKAARSVMTRAEFALSIVREIKQGGGIPFVCPDLHVKQKVAIETKADTVSTTSGADAAVDLAPGIAKGDSSLTVKGAAATSEQRANAERVLNVANSLGASTRATIALVQAVIVESTIQNLPDSPYDPGSGSRGILQVRDSTAAGMQISNRDVEQCCNAFLTRGFYTNNLGGGGAIRIAAKHPEATTGQIAQGTQGSGVPGAYDQWKAEAEKWVAAYSGTGIGSGTTSTAQSVTKLPYSFQRGGTDGTVEDSWTCLQRLAQEVGWRCFMSSGSCYFVAETTLISAKPRATLSEETLGVFAIDFDVDNGKPASDATISARVSRLSFPPGSVVVLDKCGPANGRWLVSAHARGLFDAQATITLKRETKPLPEPANETSTSDATTGLDLGALDEGGVIARAYAAATAIHGKRFPYIWGGGHAHAGTPDRGDGSDPGIGFDCSGSTGAILAAAGMGYTIGGSIPGSGTMASSWGEPGEGQTMTVWANKDHVWIEFKTSKGQQHFGTGDWGKGWGGAGFNPRMHPTSGFTPRHWKGT